MTRTTLLRTATLCAALVWIVGGCATSAPEPRPAPAAAPATFHPAFQDRPVFDLNDTAAIANANAVPPWQTAR